MKRRERDTMTALTDGANIRPATPAKWAAALARAEEAGIQAFTVNGNPNIWFVTSGSVNGSGYAVKISRFGMNPWATCQCKGSAYNEACLHKALCFSKLGILPTR